jgi:hypothetical protein
MVAMKTYRVKAKRWARGWELHIDGEGVTQSHSLGDAEGMVRDYIALMHEVPADSFDVEIVPVVGAGLDEGVRSAREAAASADAARSKAAQASRAIAARLRSAGLSGRDIAAVLGVSAQRVSQLLKNTSRSELG